jgi:rhodanese-related sulfurtransferase
MKTVSNLLFALTSLSFASAADFSLDTNKINQVTGLKGKLNAEEAVYKVSSPRTDVKISVDDWQMPPFMGLTSWAAFTAGKEKGAMVMGDLVLMQDEVSPVMRAALDNGLEVTALHNHFFFDEPKVYFMHIGGEGSAEELSRGVRAALDKVKEIRTATPQPARSSAREQLPATSSLNTEALATSLNVKGEAKDGMFKAVFGRTVKMECGCEIGKEMGVNTWAAFAGSDDNAVVDGDFAALESELQPVLKSLLKNGINIVAIHHHMTGEQPRMLFLHYWGRGKATDLANAVKIARGEQSKAGAAEARAAGGFQEIDPTHFEKHRSDGAVVLDVRSPEEFAKGHVPGALNIDINGAGFASKVSEFDKSKPILVNCHAGSRGAIASAKLAELGFKTVCNLEGGLAAWEKAGNHSENQIVRSNK